MATTKARKSAKKSAKATGSQKLRAAGTAGGQGVLLKTITALNKGNIVHDILVRGTPFPDVIRGTFRARNAKELGTAFGALFGVPGIEYKPVKLFPKGIPVIDIIEVQIDGRIRNK